MARRDRRRAVRPRHDDAPPRARGESRGVRREARRRRLQHGLRHELDDGAGARGRGRLDRVRRAEPRVHRQRLPRVGGGHPVLRAQRRGRARGGAARGRRVRPAADAAAVEEDHGDGRGHLLHGGRDLRPEGHRGRREEVQGVPLSRRGALHRRAGRDGPRRVRALRRRPRGRRRAHGDLHQELRRHGRLRRGVDGRRRPPARDVPGHPDARRHVARHVRAGDARAGHHRRRRGRPGPAEDRRLEGQLELLPGGARQGGLPRLRRLRLAHHSGVALQPDEDRRVFPGVLQARARGRRRGLPGDGPGQVARAVLRLGGAHARGSRRRGRQDQRSGAVDQDPVRGLAVWIARGPI
mmetsp:Transcript_5622/g.17764  ORF Transcript_5622/g.17764 Transcript_5622/m.17764 type:complete len:353 (+) Transcript_5622:739-1797(+)